MHSLGQIRLMSKQVVIRHFCGVQILLPLMLASLLVVVFGCTSRTTFVPPRALPKFDGEYPIKATATVGMVADLVRALGGERVEVTQLMKAGVDPHLYTATRDDSAAIMSADIVFYSGLLLEGKMSEMLERTSDTRRVFAAAESLPSKLLTNDPAQQDHPDPHVWMNVDLWRQVSVRIADELAQFDRDNRSEYIGAADRLDRQLAALHEYGKRIIAGIPEGQRVLVTSHDAFRYFGAAYGLEVQAVQGISTESEAGLRRINELVDMLVKRKIQSVFVESSVPKESIESLLRGAAEKGHNVQIGGSLYSDAMGKSGTYEGTYIGMMDHNLTTIAKALGSTTVPEGGFKGEQANAPESRRSGGGGIQASEAQTQGAANADPERSDPVDSAPVNSDSNRSDSVDTEVDPGEQSEPSEDGDKSSGSETSQATTGNGTSS